MSGEWGNPDKTVECYGRVVSVPTFTSDADQIQRLLIERELKNSLTRQEIITFDLTTPFSIVNILNSFGGHIRNNPDFIKNMHIILEKLYQSYKDQNLQYFLGLDAGSTEELLRKKFHEYLNENIITYLYGDEDVDLQDPLVAQIVSGSLSGAEKLIEIFYRRIGGKIYILNKIESRVLVYGESKVRVEGSISFHLEKDLPLYHLYSENFRSLSQILETEPTVTENDPMYQLEQLCFEFFRNLAEKYEFYQVKQKELNSLYKATDISLQTK